MNERLLFHPGSEATSSRGDVDFSRWRYRHPRISAAKAMISLFVALTSATGYVLGAGRLDAGTVWVFLGVLLLASGSATLNNLQDRRLDRQFKRTCNRTFARKALPGSHGFFQTAVLMLSGGGLLLFANNGLVVLSLGLLAVLCYNGLYTPLKMRTAWAILPGTVCGMMPPLMGWLASGGQFWSYRIWLFMMVLALWQPPHAWSILLSNADEFHSSKSRHLLPCFTVKQTRMVALCWVFGFAAVIALLPLYGVVQTPIAAMLLIVTTFLLTAFYGYLSIFNPAEGIDRFLVLPLNATLALVMLLCILDNLG